MGWSIRTDRAIKKYHEITDAVANICHEAGQKIDQLAKAKVCCRNELACILDSVMFEVTILGHLQDPGER